MPYAAVTMVSIYEHNQNKEGVDIYLICQEVTDAHRSQIEALGKKYGQTVYWCSLSESQQQVIRKSYEGLPALHEATLYRLLAAECLPTSLDKVLYMDCDAIVVGDISDCFKLDISQFGAGVVRDLFRFSDYHRLQLNHREHSYFNSGVMLINLSYWRTYHIGERCLSYLQSHKSSCILWDQDVLNAVLQGQVMYLHPKYNCMTLFCAKKSYLESRVFFEDMEDVREAVAHPVIIHYLSTKPWVKGKYVPFADEWKYYLTLTPWKNMRFGYARGWRGYIRCQVKLLLKRVCPLVYKKVCNDIYNN
jgi:lipopolysaccharide biosynthesis glycosyltransferase